MKILISVSKRNDPNIKLLMHIFIYFQCNDEEPVQLLYFPKPQLSNFFLKKENLLRSFYEKCI